MRVTLAPRSRCLYDRDMPTVDDAIEQLWTTRAQHQRRIEEIDKALELLGRTSDAELFALEVARPLGIKDAALTVLRDCAGEALDVGAILVAAFERGWHSASGNPRNALASTLAKLADAGHIERVGRGRYRTPVLALEV